MSGLFGVDIAKVVLSALDGNLRPITLYKISSTIDEYGAPAETATTYTGQGVRKSWDSRTQVARGYPAETAKIIVLQNGIPEPVNGDCIMIDGDRWRLTDKSKDPVNATWIFAGVLEVGAPPSAGTTPPSSNEFVLTWGD